MKLLHQFKNGGATRILQDQTAGVGMSVVSGFHGITRPAGGCISADGFISGAEFDAYPAIWTNDTMWRVFDLDDPLVSSDGATLLVGAQPCWAGPLLKPQKARGSVHIIADGRSQKAARSFDRRFYREIGGDWSTADTDPFNYDVDAQISTKIDGKEAVLMWPHKAHFKRNTLGNPTAWKTGIVRFISGVNIQQVDFPIIKPDGNTSDGVLEVCKATGPSGALTVQATVALDGTEPSHPTIAITGSPDLICIRLSRTTETKNADGFRVRIGPIGINGRAGSNNNMTTSAVVTDVATSIGGDTSGIVASSTVAMPQDFEESSAAAIFDQMALLDDRVWMAEDDGTQTKWIYRAYGNKTWRLTEPHFSPKVLDGQPLLNKALVPYRSPGGVKLTTHVTAVPDPYPGQSYEQRVDLTEPYPPLALAQSVGAVVANYYATERYETSATFSYIQDESALGTNLTATRVHSGDKLKFPYNGGVVLRVTQLDIYSSKVTASCRGGHSLLERIIALRFLKTARGAGQTKATLGVLNLKKPAQPENATVAFRQDDVRGGHVDYSAIVKWDEVTLDIAGTPSFMREYVVHLRYRDSTNADAIVPDADGDPIIHKETVKLKDLNDSPADLPTKVIFKHLLNPHIYKVQVRLEAIDMLHKQSGFTAWSTATKPAAFGPPAITNLTLDASKRQLQAEWDSDDPTETQSDDSAPTLDRRVAHFRCVRKLNTVNQGKIIRTRAEHHHWRTPGVVVGDVESVEVTAFDHYGNASAVVGADITVASDPTHTHAGGSHTHPHTTTHSHSHTHAGGSHTHPHTGTHTHPHTGTHDHDADHNHKIANHTGHAHGGDTGSAGSGATDSAGAGLTDGPSGTTNSFPAAGANHTHHGPSHTHGGSAHTHTITSGGSHAHGQPLDGGIDETSNTGGAISKMLGSSTSTRVQLVAPGTTDTAAPGSTDAGSATTGGDATSTAPGSTDAASATTAINTDT